MGQALPYFYGEGILSQDDVIGDATGNIFNSGITNLLNLLTNHDGKVGMGEYLFLYFVSYDMIYNTNSVCFDLLSSHLF